MVLAWVVETYWATQKEKKKTDTLNQMVEGEKKRDEILSCVST